MLVAVQRCRDEAPALIRRIERGCAADTEVLCVRNEPGRADNKNEELPLIIASHFLQCNLHLERKLLCSMLDPPASSTCSEDLKQQH